MSTHNITVITVSFNCRGIIEETILSIINQTYDRIEYIVIDGGSTDGTIEIINKYRNSISKFVSEPDKGIYDAMNKGIRLATGDWINFMNAGDTFVDNRTIENFFSNVKNQDGDKILYGDVILKYPFGKYLRICKNQNWCHQSIFAKAKLMKKYEFNVKYKIMADADFICKAVKDGAVLEYIPIAVSVYESYEGASSINFFRLFQEESRIYNKKKNLTWIAKYMKLYCRDFLHRHFDLHFSASNLENLQNTVDSNKDLIKI